MSLTEAPISTSDHPRPSPRAQADRCRPTAIASTSDAAGLVQRSSNHDQPAEAAAQPERLLLEADEITFKVGDAVLTMTRENGGTLEIRAPNVRIMGEDVLSEAERTNTIVGENVVSEATMHADLLGKLIRIDGQFVKINS